MDLNSQSPLTRRRVARGALALLGALGLGKLISPAAAQWYPQQQQYAPPQWVPGGPPPPGFWENMRDAREHLRMAREALLRAPADPYGRRDRALRNINQAEDDLRGERWR